MTFVDKDKVLGLVKELKDELAGWMQSDHEMYKHVARENGTGGIQRAVHQLDGLMGDLAELDAPEDGWDLAVTRAAEQLRKQMMQPSPLHWSDDDLRQQGEKILDRAAPRGVFAIAQQILADPHRYDHLVQFRDEGWTVQHPVQERLDGTLFECQFSETYWVMAIDMAYQRGERGRFRMWQAPMGELGLELVAELE